MTKNELDKHIADILGDVEDALANVKELKRELESIQNKLDYIDINELKEEEKEED